MTRSLLSAASGMKAQQLKVDTIANNIANASTPGYKKSELSFRSLLYQTYREPGAPNGGGQSNPTGLQFGSGAEISDSFKIHTQGVLEPTGGQFNMAIEGEGFFEVLLPSGEIRYTRDGNFHRDAAGTLTNPSGYTLNGAPAIPADAISVQISPDGVISTINSEGALPTQVGNVTLTRFPNPAGLKAQGGNLYSPTAASGAAQQQQPGLTGTGVIRQGARERSNIQVVDELVALILAQRNYEVNSRAIKVSDEMLQEINQLAR
ncbi:MAG: flagellar basal-body rod protein FlgG [Planctomycetota bacterium]